MNRTILVAIVYGILFIVFGVSGMFIPDSVTGPVIPVFLSGFCLAISICLIANR